MEIDVLHIYRVMQNMLKSLGSATEFQGFQSVALSEYCVQFTDSDVIEVLCSCCYPIDIRNIYLHVKSEGRLSLSVLRKR